MPGKYEQLTPQEFSKKTGMKLWQVYKWIQSRLLTTTQDGKYYFIHYDPDEWKVIQKKHGVRSSKVLHSLWRMKAATSALTKEVDGMIETEMIRQRFIHRRKKP